MHFQKSSNSKEFGKKGEESAKAHVTGKGFSIIERNFRFGKIGEIDIIARKNDLILFIEVKSRMSSLYGGAGYAVNEKKKQRLKKTAGHFLFTHPEYNTKDYTFRFDLLTIENGQIEWIEDIIR